MRITLFLLMLVALLGFHSPVRACSSAVISGSATADGRPLLWKHRDTSKTENHAQYFSGDKYSFIGVLNTEDIKEEQVWMGGNSAGFCIMNTAVRNLPKGDIYDGPMDQEGYIMKEALGKCATVDEFEQMLKDSAGNRGALANFGVIDAHGGAAYFETNPDSYTRFDATDPAVAPNGYLVRTNYSYSGEEGKGGGYVRHDTLQSRFADHHDKRLTAEYLLLDSTRCLENSLLGVDLRESVLPETGATAKYIMLRDYVVRPTSVSSQVAQGVKPGEDPSLTTLWTIPSFPLTSMLVPLWVEAGAPLPPSIVANKGDDALITKKALALKANAFPVRNNDGREYLDLATVLNKGGDGILQRVLNQDRTTISNANDLIAEWRSNGFDPEQARKFYDEMEKRINEFYADVETANLSESVKAEEREYTND